MPALARAVTTSLPDLALAAFFLTVWLDPFRFGEGMVGTLLLVMILEFIIVHASGFMAVIIFGQSSRLKKILLLGGLGLVESIFVAGFCLSFGAWWPMASFWGLTVNRMLAVLLNPADGAGPGMFLGSQWAMSIVFYLGGTFLTLMAPVPALGMTQEVYPRLGLTGGGIWIEEPHRVVAFGVIYFAAQGLWGMILPFLFPGRPRNNLY